MTAELEPRTAPPPIAIVEHQLRQQHRLMLLPPLASTGVVWSGGWMHDRIMATLAVGGAEMLLVGIVGGVVTAVFSAGAATLYAARAASLDGLPPARKLFGGAAAAGLALTLFGDVTLLVAGVYGTGLLGLGRWYRARWAKRAGLKQQRESLLALAAAPEQQPEADDPSIMDAEIVEPVEQVDPDVFVVRWQQGATKHLPDTVLVPLPGAGLAYVVQAGPNGVTLEAANTAREKIAGALRLALPGPRTGGQDIVFDQPTDGTLTDRSQLRAQIVDLAVAAAAGRRVTGQLEHAPGKPCSFRIGGYIDDGSPYFYDLADGDGAWSGVLLGGTGMGKSSVGDHIAYNAMRVNFDVAYLDPQRGASSPVLAAHAQYPALGPEHAEAFLRFLEECADTRETWMAMHAGVGTITWNMTAPCAPDGTHPDPNCPCGSIVPPGILAPIEECDQVFNAAHAGTNTKLAERYGQLAKRIRKLNMALLAMTQMPELKTFGGSELLRSNLPVRNLLAMHISSNVSGTLIPGLPYSPKLLPKTSGRGLACGRDTRTMQVALDYTPRREKAAEGVPGPYAEDLFEVLPPRRRYELDEVAWRRHFPKTAVDAVTANREAARARFTAKRNGTAPPPVAAPVASTATGTLTWPKPVVLVGGRSASKLADLVHAVQGLRDDAWITAGELARRTGRVPADASIGEVQAASRALGAQLAALGIELRKREAGMSVTAGALRAGAA
ncbi:hypothetical protein PV646_28620 [Streptomyces sp. ID05-26A]|nr:hypothetical protein [Streptomyces sp. ID05-26A]